MEYKRRLVFHFYAPKNWLDFKSIKLHLNCLKHYSNVFTEALFVISVDDQNDFSHINAVEHTILDCGFKNVAFKVIKNGYLCETETIYNEIISKLDKLDGLTFFGHVKGVGDEKYERISMENLYEWICGLYFLSLEFPTEVERYLYDFKEISYGSYKTYTDVISNKYNWIYSGTFFWLNTQKLYNKIKAEQIPVRYPADRFFSEVFLGDLYDSNILKEDKFSEAASHLGSYLIHANDYYGHVQDYTKLILGDTDLQNFYEFKEKMIENL